jgi:hypothetical protein
MFGEYDIPLKIDQENLSISVQKEDGRFLYRRNCLEERMEINFMVDHGKINFTPVEPVNKPKSLTTYLFIKLEKSIIIEPKSTVKVFLKFPIEIGVYLSNNNDTQLLDVFTFTKPKYTVYGDPRNGVLCKYWKSDICTSTPTVDPLYEGVIQLKIENTNPAWVEISKAVFNAYGMKVYYNDRMVAMKAVMRIRSGDIADTDFRDSPIEKGMTNALEIYMARKLSITSQEFVMEYGL